MRDHQLPDNHSGFVFGDEIGPFGRIGKAGVDAASDGRRVEQFVLGFESHGRIIAGENLDVLD